MKTTRPNRMLIWGAIILALTLVQGRGLSAAGIEQGRVSKETLLRELFEKVLRPRYENLHSACRRLDEASAALRANPSPKTLQQAEDTWTAAMLEARRVQVYKVGPITDLECDSTFFYWQTLPGRIEDLLASARALDDSCLDMLGATAKGLFAVEYLLFDYPAAASAKGPSALPVRPPLLSVDQSARRYQFLTLLTRDLRHKSGLLADAWRQSGAASPGETFVNGGQQTLNVMVNQFVSETETIVIHLNLVLHLKAPLGPQLHRIQGARSGSSVAGIHERLASLQELYRGANTGIDDYLRGLNPALAEKLDQQLSLALSRVEAIGTGLEEAALTNRDAIRQAHQAVHDLEILFKVDLASALGVTITFSSNDGD